MRSSSKALADTFAACSRFSESWHVDTFGCDNHIAAGPSCWAHAHNLAARCTDFLDVFFYFFGLALMFRACVPIFANWSCARFNVSADILHLRQASPTAVLEGLLGQ
eukprot:TRINITY_DN11682_c0_g1_i1.p1 TRINITY_DN11682_c0_g1~~TRINITY_DN11682_c0_g1_i1.p1  ORF type:complete len:107 (-),score=0.31 TRINITY_DN11682_c0_g1_i1:93-413(-)